MNHHAFHTLARRPLLRIIALASLSTLAACSSDDDNNDPAATEGTQAFTATRSSDFGSGRIDRLTTSGGITVNGSYPATLSDIRVTTDGESIYQIGRFNIDSITRFDPNDTSVVDYQYSVNGDETSANPYSLAFANENKAYLTRYGSTMAWIINPAATTEAEFKIGELDLTAYDDDVPNMSDTLIVGNRLFVLMERLSNGFVPDKGGYVAVFDINDDSEVETSQGTEALKGIALETVNPTSLQYNADTDEIYVLGRGNFFENDAVTDDFYSGGLETIDPETFENALLIDDGTADANEGGYFVDALVASPSRGYLLTYASFGVTTLRSFNPTTGLLDEQPVGNLTDQDLTSLALAPDGKLWVGVGGATPGFFIVDPADNSVAADAVATELVPLNVIFLSDTSPE